MKYFVYKVNHKFDRPGGFQEATDAEDKIWSCLKMFHQEVDNIDHADIAFIGLNNASFYSDRDALKKIWQESVYPKLINKDIPHVAIFTYVVNENDLSFIPPWITIWAYETECSHHNSPSLQTTDSGCGDRMCMIPYVLTPQTHPAAGVVETTNINSENFNAELWTMRSDTAFIGSLQADGRPRIHARANQVFCWQSHIGCDIYADRQITEPNGTYSKYKFALILRGDTPTRKAFYQAIAAGTFPIITESAWQQYSELYRGHCESLADIVVIVPDNTELWNYSKIQEILSERIKKCDVLLPRLHNWASKYLDYDNGGVVDAAILATLEKTQKIMLPLAYIHCLEPASKYRPTSLQVSEQERINEINILDSQYALEYIMLRTVDRYPYKTACLDKATAAIVPIYTFLTCWHQPNHYSVADSVNVVKSALSALPAWKSSSVPHYLGYADVLWDDERVFLQHVQLPQNTTVIALETCDISIKQEAVPFPCGSVPDNFSSADRRLAVYIGRDREAVRKYDIDYDIVNTSGWHSTNTQNTRIMQSYSQHKFSLQPHGDRATRRGFYQSIACGCVPVITADCVKAYSEATKTDISEFCVIIPEWHENVVELLNQTDFESMQKKLPRLSLPDSILKIMKLH